MTNIIVTGGASGVGAALVKRLAANSTVWSIDIQTPIEPQDGVHYLSANLAAFASLSDVISQLPDTINGLANVAGMARADDPGTVLAVNFLALRELTEQLTTRMPKGAAIANVSSIAGRDWLPRLEKLEPLLSTTSYGDGADWCASHSDLIARDPYTFSKRMATAYTLRRAAEFVTTGVRVNCVSPGPIATPLYPQFEALMGKAHSDWTIEQIGGSASPDDIAQVLEYLLVGDSRWVNGVDIPVDGGYSAGLEAGWIDFDQSPVMQAIRKKRGG